MQDENDDIDINQQQIQNNAIQLKDLETNLAGLIQEYNLYQTQLQTATAQTDTAQTASTSSTTDSWVGGGGTYTSGNVYVNSVDKNAKSTYINTYTAISTTSPPNGTKIINSGNPNYTRQDCQNSALNSGYKYYGLQNYTTTNGVSGASCILSQDVTNTFTTTSANTGTCSTATNGDTIGLYTSPASYPLYTNADGYKGCYKITTTSPNNINGYEAPLPLTMNGMTQIIITSSTYTSNISGFGANNFWHSTTINKDATATCIWPNQGVTTANQTVVFSYTYIVPSTVTTSISPFMYCNCVNAYKIFINGHFTKISTQWVDQDQSYHWSPIGSYSAGQTITVQCECFALVPTGAFLFSMATLAGNVETGTPTVLFNTSQPYFYNISPASNALWKMYNFTSTTGVTATECKTQATGANSIYSLIKTSLFTNVNGTTTTPEISLCYADTPANNFGQTQTNTVNYTTVNGDNYGNTGYVSVYNANTNNDNTSFSLLGNAGYVGPNNTIQVYPSSMISKGENYYKVSNLKSNGTVLETIGPLGGVDTTYCKDECDENNSCWGFTFTTTDATAGKGTCVLQGKNILGDPTAYTLTGTDTYYNEPVIAGGDASCPTDMMPIDSVEWNSYTQGQAMANNTKCPGGGDHHHGQDIIVIIDRLNELGPQIVELIKKILIIIIFLKSQNDINIQSVGLNRNTINNYLDKYQSLGLEYDKYNDETGDNIMNDTKIKLKSTTYHYNIWIFSAFILLVLLILLLMDASFLMYIILANIIILYVLFILFSR